MLGSLACSESNFQIEFGYRWMTIELITKGPLLKACIVGKPEVIPAYRPLFFALENLANG
jgi:hypothetical protein